MSLLTSLKSNGPTGFGAASTAEAVTAGLDLHGRTMLVTGCTSGLGLETVRVLAERGARVFGAARTEEKARAMASKVGKDFVPIACELSDPSSVRACVATIKARGDKLDGIICNAGIMGLPRLEQAFGYELQFFTNHVGHFMLVTGLVDQLTDDARVVVVSSALYRRAPNGTIAFDNLSGEKEYHPWKAYGHSKLANILFAKHLAQRFAGTKRTANAIHPGVIKTNLGRSMPAFSNAVLGLVSPIFLKSVAQGAATQTFVATNPQVSGISGEYFVDCNVAEPEPFARDAALAERLWQESEKIVSNLN